MKKKTQYSDKYGKVVTEGEVVEERQSPGATLSPKEEKAVAAEQLDENPNANAGPKEEKAVVAKKVKKSKSE